MKVRRLDDEHDWTFGSGLSDYLSKSDAIKQSVECVLMSFETNWFLNIKHGIAWFKYLRKNPNIKDLEFEIKNAVLSVTGVTKISHYDLSLDRETRRAKITLGYIDVYKQERVVNHVAGQ